MQLPSHAFHVITEGILIQHLIGIDDPISLEINTDYFDISRVTICSKCRFLVQKTLGESLDARHAYVVCVRTSHDLILRHASSPFCSLHGVGTVRILVLDVGKAERTPAVLVASEFGYDTISAI